jgi:catechol 2,3-dioxygenase-like lactoylglutathione lyase family enzyme
MSRTDSRPTLTSAAPQFLVQDLDAACAFYRDQLGFEIAFRYGEPAFYAGVARDGVSLHLKQTDEPEPSRRFKLQGKHLDVYIQTRNIEALHDEYAARGVAPLKPLQSTPWGTREFALQDPDGYILYFGQPAA